MNFGDIVGQMLQQGMGTGSTRSRLESALGQGGLGGIGGMEDILGKIMSGQGGASSQFSGGGQRGGGLGGGGLGGLLGSLTGMLGGRGQGGMSNAQLGGIGALAGALLGGGGGAARGALGGSAMAVLGSMALSALKNWQSQGQGGAQAATASPQLSVSDEEVQRMVAPETAELCLKGMIAAAKSDGQIQDDEMQRIVGKLEEGGVTSDERQFVLDEMRQPLDVNALARQIPDQQVAAQVYAASLMAISVDTEGERNFLIQLANNCGLDRHAVARLHQMCGAPQL